VIHIANGSCVVPLNYNFRVVTQPPSVFTFPYCGHASGEHSVGFSVGGGLDMGEWVPFFRKEDTFSVGYQIYRHPSASVRRAGSGSIA
jgi:hypothetical protein